jgi:Ca2+:H+ antiporter
MTGVSRASVVSTKDRAVLAGAGLATVVAGVTSQIGAGAVLPFICAAAALSLLAMVVGEATDQLGARLSPGATGVLQSALGNLPELFVCIFSLRAGLTEVVKGALIGSILANSLLVLGLAILLGGIKNGVQRFASEPPKMMATLMLLASAALAVPTLTAYLHTPAAAHEGALSVAVSVVLILTFACSLPFFL